MANGAPNVWTQMNYVPPRGPCNHKASYLSSTCACLRFMLHPLKSSSSYECDGCGHHASFHSMENKADDEIRKRWEQEAMDRAEAGDHPQQRSKKRVRAIEYTGISGIATGSSQENDCPSSSTRAVQSTQKPAPTTTRAAAGRKTARTPGTRSNSRYTDGMEEEDLVVELD
ncbi:hypothetical protein ACN47E_000049 [Coniothyrium glycines]